jgi:cellulose synthase/poly-beta-1,6-N-acetylglucosamine synthase-like glycosyltransferase
MILFEAVLLVYFAFISSYALILAIAGHFFRKPNPAVSAFKNRFAVLIPSYKEDRVILEVAKQALAQRYPSERYEVIIIADSMKTETLSELRRLPVTVVEVAFDRSTKVKSLNQAMSLIGDGYDYAVILDADNVMEAQFLDKINNLIGNGYQAIQAERVSKNQTTSMSVLDGFSERINNFIYRQGHVAIGLSCSLIGSGMVFPYRMVKGILSQLDSIGGFDRELELHLIRRGVKIYYAKETLVYDEKVENTEVFERQRTRWLSSQFVYLRKYFAEGTSALLRGNISLFNSAILKNVQLPRIINLGLLGVLSVVAILLNDYLTIPYYVWAAFFLANVTAMALAIPAKLYNREMFRSILLLPKVILKMFALLFRLKGANKSFIHTPHGVTKLSAEEKNNR